MSPLKLVLLVLALILPGGTLVLLAMAAWNAVRRRPVLAPAKLELPPARRTAP